MDFTQAALLIASVFAVIELIKQAVPTLPSAVTQALSVAVGIGVAFIIANSTWGHTQIVNGVTLDKVNAAGLVIVGLMIAGGANVAHKLIGNGGAIANIGQNQPVDNPPTDTTTTV